MKIKAQPIRKLGSYLFVVLFLTSFQPLEAFNSNAVIDSLAMMLNRRPTYREQVRLLHNIIDLTSNKKSILYYNKQLLDLAAKHHDENLQLEAVRNLFNNDSNDKQEDYIDYVKGLPTSNVQKEVLVFMDYSQTMHTMSGKTFEEKAELLNELIERSKENKGTDIYQQTRDLFNLCGILSFMSTGELYAQYLNNLGKIVSRLPRDGRKILPNVYYTLAAGYYSRKDMQKKALEADRQILAMAPELLKQYRQQGRIYRNVDQFCYISYRRMLTYTSVLNLKQINYIYLQMLAIANRNPMVHQDMFSPTSISQIRYNMATKRYVDAKPILDKVLQSKGDSVKWIHNECLKDRIIVSKALHSEFGLLTYMPQYIDLLERERNEAVEEKAKELQVLYQVNDLNEQVLKLQLKNKETEVKFNRLFSLSSLLILILVIAILVGTIKALRRSKRMGRSLKISEKELITEKTHLAETLKKLEKAYLAAEEGSKMKNKFIHNMNHEIRTPLNAIVGFSQIIAEAVKGTSEQSEFNEYSRHIIDNSDILLNIINEVLFVSQMESSEIPLRIAPCKVKVACETAVTRAHKNVKEGVKMYVKSHTEDVIIRTDERQITELLYCLLNNATKFTAKGEIVVDYHRNEKEREIVFSVTDTGIGIPPEKSEIIFERFEKLNSFEPGTGLGLYLCRIISKALHGKVTLDTSYHDGARFIFVHPLN